MKTDHPEPSWQLGNNLNVSHTPHSTKHVNINRCVIIKKASVGMYSRCNYPLQILFVYFLTLPSLLHPSILFSCFYTCILLCDPLWKNRPLAIFCENRISSMDRRRFYCRVQQSKSQALKSLLRWVIAKKLYTGHPYLSSQFFKKWSVLYVHSSTFNVSVYALYYTTQFAP